MNDEFSAALVKKPSDFLPRMKSRRLPAFFKPTSKPKPIKAFIMAFFF
jgi:hypothetical protein